MKLENSLKLFSFIGGEVINNIITKDPMPLIPHTRLKCKVGCSAKGFLRFEYWEEFMVVYHAIAVLAENDPFTFEAEYTRIFLENVDTVFVDIKAMGEACVEFIDYAETHNTPTESYKLTVLKFT